MWQLERILVEHCCKRSPGNRWVLKRPLITGTLQSDSSAAWVIY